MPTLLQCIDLLLDNISVSDRQEENITTSLSNIEGYLNDKENDLSISRTFTNGSYERDTIIRPLNDIDIFAVLRRDDWKNEYGQLPNPQSVLTKIKNYLNGLTDYKDKVKQSRPCVTIELSNKDFDILPSFELAGGGYEIPNHNLKSWITTYPEQLSSDLDITHKKCNYRLKQVIKVVKYWNREQGKVIPSFHVEEIAINIFTIHSFKNFEEAIRIWFNNAEYELHADKLYSNDEYNAILKKIRSVRDKLNNAKTDFDAGKEGEAIQIWKTIFGKEFPTVDIGEAKQFSKSLSEGTLKVGASGLLSTAVGKAVSSSKGFFGGISKD
jgi:hypothetical protein